MGRRDQWGQVLAQRGQAGLKRRTLVMGAGLALSATMPARAQKIPRIGILFAADPEPSMGWLRKAMTALGYVEGRTVVYDIRIADPGDDVGALARALVDSKPDVIVPMLSPAVAAVRPLTSTIPIVFNGGAPNIGLVSNLARPEGNMTGVYSPSPGFAGKGLQLFREFRPAIKRVGLLLNASDPFHVPLRQDVETVARAENIETVPVELKSREELPQAIEAMARHGVDAALVQPTLGLERAAALSLTARLPAYSFRREFVESGGLLSYGADQAELQHLVAGHLDRILKGARPSDLPVLQSTKVELVVNRKTARALGIDFPPMFLARVDEVIE
jgi:putative ABC transport system substrate-binding protein